MSILGNPNAQQMPPEQMPQEQMPAEPMPDEMEGEEEASPEEQAMHDEYVRAAVGAAVSTENIYKAMVQNMRAARSNLPNAIATLAVTLYDKGEEKLGPLPNPDVQEAVMESVIEKLLIIAAEETLIAVDKITEDMAVEIYTMAARQWIEKHPDRADEEDMQALEEMKAQGGQAQPMPQEQAPQPNIMGQ